MSPLARRTSARPVGSAGGRGVVGHNVGTFLQPARSGRGGSARASAGDRAVEAQGGLASLRRLLGSSPHCRRRRSAPAARGVGVGKRRWYATIFSFERPRSRSISTERCGRSLSQAGFTPRSSSPWPLPCRPLVFTRASSVFIPAVPPKAPPQCIAVYDNTHRLYGVPLEFDKECVGWPLGDAQKLLLHFMKSRRDAVVPFWME